MPVHVYCAEGEAKFWLDPQVALARNTGLSATRLNELRRIVEERRDDIVSAWNEHFRR